MHLLTLQQRYHQVIEQIHVCQAQSPYQQSVHLLAVSKTHPAESVRTLYTLGQRDFAENYLQEALTKQKALLDLAIRWHYIGNIQSNKTRILASHFDWVHSVDRLIIAERLNVQRPAHLGCLPICLQVNIDLEPSKGGCLPDDVPMLVAQISRLPNLHLRGLMCIPSQNNPQAFSQMQRLFSQVADVHANPALWDTLSMGMSGDLSQAIHAGATHVRIGTAIFGSRQ